MISHFARAILISFCFNHRTFDKNVKLENRKLLHLVFSYFHVRWFWKKISYIYIIYSCITFLATVDNQQALTQDVVAILKFLCDKLKVALDSGTKGHQTEPLLLEGILSILANVPISIRDSIQFTDLIWSVSLTTVCPKFFV